ncbi:MAG: MBL fold metallo-hydrolase, partial [Alphaproteobacteria bacterium]|nr:MBL fold metallo-hydrolase [Alphaproteobacteria bacterium]MDX5370327.1 MBL fold metallo-hydrolase [Alphaproteobacteria bacterium]MDX5464863.1 MBL fold metallo-hydrolase [Alphaproteobacteria bacterium]
MSGIPFDQTADRDYEVLKPVGPKLRRIQAENPGPFTFMGTGTYVIGEGEVAVVDPGPRDEAHVAAIVKALEGERITHILVTHTHLDHSPAAALLIEAAGVATYAFWPHGSGAGPDTPVEEGGDMDFRPDV